MLVIRSFPRMLLADGNSYDMSIILRYVVVASVSDLARCSHRYRWCRNATAPPPLNSTYKELSKDQHGQSVLR